VKYSGTKQFLYNHLKSGNTIGFDGFIYYLLDDVLYIDSHEKSSWSLEEFLKEVTSEKREKEISCYGEDHEKTISIQRELQSRKETKFFKSCK